MKLGIVGVGITGGALRSYLFERNHEILCRDPAKDLNDDLSKCEAVFICVPVPTDEQTWQQDLRILKQVLKEHDKMRVPVFIRSTVLPKTTDHLKKIFRMDLHAMPEFLTERQSDKDMESQDLICGCEPDPRLREDLETLLLKIFPDKIAALMTNREAEAAKLLHNAFGSVKVNFFNTAAKYCEVIGAKYENVLDGMLMSGYINDTHTQVPGPDGKHGFGGKCFPKDLAALIKEFNRLNIQSGVLTCTMAENAIYRTSWDKDNFKQPQIKFDEKVKILCNGQ